MQTTLESLQSDVDTLKSRTDVADSDRMETKQLLKGLKFDVGRLRVDADSLYVLIEPVGIDITRVVQGIGELKSDVSGLKTDVSGLKSDVSGLKTDVSGLKSDVSGLKSDVSELKDGMDAIMRHLGIK